MKTTTRKLNILKAVAVSVIANTAQILAMVVVLLYMANTAHGGDRLFERVIAVAVFFIVTVGAATDVQVRNLFYGTIPKEAARACILSRRE